MIHGHDGFDGYLQTCGVRHDDGDGLESRDDEGW
jgi:hypothetical protein